MKHYLMAAAALMLCACSNPPAQPQPVAKRPAPIVHVDRAAMISPAVAALLAPDPDLDKKLTPDEVKAALAAAQSQPPPAGPAVASLTVNRNKNDWDNLQDAKDAKKAAYEQRLASTYVFTAPDGKYHTGGCAAMYENVIDRGTGQVVSRRFVGNQITLAYAKSSGLGRHDACGAPSFEFQ